MQRIKTMLNQEQPIKWLFCGASITHGAMHTLGARDFSEHFAERLRFEMSRRMDIVYNTAVSGNTTRDLLAGFDRRIGAFSPQVVFLMIGGNDSAPAKEISEEQYATNLQELADRIEAFGGLPVFQTSCPILPFMHADRAPQVAAYMNVMRRVAEQRGNPLVDHEAFWLEHRAQHELWMNDAFHPNYYGHRVMALLILKELGMFDPQSRTCRMSFPGCETIWDTAFHAA